MTITIKRSTAVIFIALAGVLGGLALGQVTQALSASEPSATASYTPPFERTLKEIARDLRSIKRAIGDRGFGDSILDELGKIRGNIYGTCQAAGGSPSCSPF